jgi:hypothetical protein
LSPSPGITTPENQRTETIVEENEVLSKLPTTEQLIPSEATEKSRTRKENDCNISTASSDGKMSALIPKLNEPVNDETLRIKQLSKYLDYPSRAPRK